MAFEKRAYVAMNENERKRGRNTREAYRSKVNAVRRRSLLLLKCQSLTHSPTQHYKHSRHSPRAVCLTHIHAYNDENKNNNNSNNKKKFLSFAHSSSMCTIAVFLIIVVLVVHFIQCRFTVVILCMQRLFCSFFFYF